MAKTGLEAGAWEENQQLKQDETATLPLVVQQRCLLSGVSYSTEAGNALVKEGLIQLRVNQQHDSWANTIRV